MAYPDFVLETSTSVGGGNLTLDGAVVGHRTFASVYTPVTDAVYYGIRAVDADGVPTGEWEVGLGRLTVGGQLERLITHASSNSDAPVTFSAGTKRVYAAQSVAAVIALINSAISAHVAASDPHGDRAAAAGYTDEAVNDHVAASDPHGDRAYVDGYARPGVLALSSDTIVVDFADERLQTRTAAGAVTIDAAGYVADRETVVVVTNGTGGAVAVTAVGAWVWLTDQPTTLAAGEVGRLTLLSTTTAESGTQAKWEVEVFDLASPALLASGHSWIPPGNATTAPLAIGGPAVTASGTATARTVAATSLFQSQRRLGYVSATTANAFAGWRSTQAQWHRGALGGGIHHVIRFGISDASLVSNARTFVGLMDTTSAVNTDPSIRTNIIGIGQDRGDADFSFFHNDAAGAAVKVPTGMAVELDALYELSIVARPVTTDPAVIPPPAPTPVVEVPPVPLADAIAARTAELQQAIRDHADAHLPPSEREALASIAAGLVERRTFGLDLTEQEQGVAVGLIMARDWTMRATALGGEVAARCAACTSAEELAAVTVDLASLGEPPRVTAGEVALALRGA